MQIACSHCGATYVFDAALIPADGYDARCTSCQAVFFVHPEHRDRAGQATTGQAGAAQSRPHNGASSGDADDIKPHFAAESLHRGTMEIDLRDVPTPAGRKDAAPRSPTIDVDLDMGSRFAGGAPLDPTRGRGRGRHSATDADHEPLLMRRPWARRGLFLGVALVAVVGSGVVVGVVCSKRLHAPPSVQPPIHIVRAPDPIAAEAFNRGLKALWDDTSKGYVAAAKAFDAACARDPEFTDAWAGAALAALLQASDIEAQAQARSRSALAQTRAALASSRERDPQTTGGTGTDDATDSDSDDGHDAVSAAQALRMAASRAAQVQEGWTQVQALHDQALALQRRGASLLLHGDHLMAQTPLMAAAQAMWYVTDATSLHLARQQLRAFEQLTGGDCVPVEADPNSCVDGSGAGSADGNSTLSLPPRPSLGPKVGQAPYGPLALWIEAKLKAQDKQVPAQDVVAAYEGALILQPELRRARWELAQYQQQMGRTDVARPLLEDLAHGDAPHDKAQAELQRLSGSHTAGTRP